MRESTRIVITEQDWLRLETLLDQVAKTPNTEWLQAELDRAEVVPTGSVSPDVVTMNSTVRYLDESTGKESDVTIVFPQHADIKRGRVSVLAPVGSALIGLSVGQRIEWKMPDGHSKTLRVCRIVYQPENDNGDLSSLPAAAER